MTAFLSSWHLWQTVDWNSFSIVLVYSWWFNAMTHWNLGSYVFIVASFRI